MALHRRLAAFVLLSLSTSWIGCPGGDADYAFDYDGDGVYDVDDCNPEDETIYPGATDDHGESLHEVTLTRSFEIGAHEVTQAFYEGVMGWNPMDQWYWEPDAWGDDVPVHHITWFEALAFANEVSKDAGLEPCYVFDDVDCEDYWEVDDDYMACFGFFHMGIVDAHVTLVGGGGSSPYDCEGYRLPTAAEFEYAARAGGTVTGLFPNGGFYDPSDEYNCFGDVLLDNGVYLHDFAWYCGNSSGYPEPVGGLTPNAIGLYDMSGNVQEWNHDRWAWISADPRTDPHNTGQSDSRVARGGGYDHIAAGLRIASIDYFAPDTRHDRVGLRLARTVNP